jgi:hypothetical protein
MPYRLPGVWTQTGTRLYALTSSSPISRSWRACAAQIAAVRTIG